MRYSVTWLFVLFITSINTVRAQHAEPGTSPFTGVYAEGNKTFVMVDGKWYEPLAIDGTPASHIIEFCQYAYKNNWLKHFSEELVEVMQTMKTPLHKKARLELLDHNVHVSKRVTATKDNMAAIKAYNATHNQFNVQNQQDGEANGNVKLSKEQPYAFKSARIEYLYTGSKTAEGKEILYIDDHGRTIVVIHDKRKEETDKDIQTIVWKNHRTVYIDHGLKTIHESSERDKATLPMPIGYATKEERAQQGYIHKGEQVIAGKTCQIYEHPQQKVTYWIWQGACLKEKHDTYSKIAAAVFENAIIPSGVTNIPGDYKLQ